MLKLFRHSNLVRYGLFLVAVAFVLCPHAAHEPLSEAADAVAHQVAPDGPVEGSDGAADHDHGHCDMDAAHSHDVRLTVSQITLPPSVLRASLLLDTRCLTGMHLAEAHRASADNVPDGVLTQLGAVRLLI